MGPVSLDLITSCKELLEDIPDIVLNYNWNSFNGQVSRKFLGKYLSYEANGS